MKRKTAEHLALASWLLPILCAAGYIPVYYTGRIANIPIAFAAGLACLFGLLAGLIALYQVPYFGKKHIFHHAVVGITLTALFLGIILMFTIIVFSFA